jgi:hypothetical protein
VLLTTVSLTVEKHFCGDNLVDLSLFTATTKCGIDSELQTQHHETLQKSCCKDVVEVISSQNKLDVNSKKDFSKFQKQFVAIFLYSYKNLFEISVEKQTLSLIYNAPLLAYDLTILDQVFLI